MSAITIILFVTFIFNVSASVINLNVFEDGDNKASYSLHDCDFRGCDQMCRRLGFTGGVCVGDKCKCDINKALPDANKAFYEVDDCNYQACDQLCRRLGFPGGACVGDRCSCDNFKKEEKSVLFTSPEKPSKPLESCEFSTCNQMCQRVNRLGGFCLGDQCVCY